MSSLAQESQTALEDQEQRIDPDRQRLAKRYAEQKRALVAAEVFLSLAYLVAWQFALGRMRSSIEGAAGIGLLFVAVVVLLEVVSLPNAWLDYQLSRGYGISTQSAGSWLADQLKGLALSLLLGGALIELAYWFIRAQPEWWWLITAGVMVLFTVVLANLAPVLIAPLFFKFTPLEDAALSERLLALVRNAGTTVRGVFTMHLSKKTTAANAVLMGWGNTCRIVVGDTLAERFSHDETEAVLAHELGHHVHHEIWRTIALQCTLGLVSLWLTHLSYETLHSAGWLGALADARNMPAIGLLFGLWTAIFTPLSNWASRLAERRADVYALRVAGKPRAFAGSMIRLANQNLAEVNPPRWVELLLYDHPAIRRRLELVERYAAAKSSR